MTFNRIVDSLSEIVTACQLKFTAPRMLFIRYESAQPLLVFANSLSQHRNSLDAVHHHPIVTPSTHKTGRYGLL
jgi:hypothetical protein